ncbi:M9 family metallopeptidase [Kitasatospora sp. NBC_01287]|uniref:M9 family metallopeptidase n=1 Tax=Kitasatospora sp. NBC_01287 TaxID=2903573 RepID=UPI002252CE06|nr:M9 family metallopeptidase [Kitasatospora sp. NBC_01287]MCX4744682.1 M9 family metallopeptidase [Kitasatospora sp. NBC_01287]
MRHRFALPRFLAATLAAGIATAGLLAPPAFAATAPKSSTSAPAPTAGAPRSSAPLGATTSRSTQADVRSQRVNAAQQPPVSPAAPATPVPAKSSASSTSTASKPSARSKAANLAAAQSCTAADFGSRSGAALVSYIQSSTTDCVNTLFTVTGSAAHSVFNEAQMVTVANAFRSSSATYPGDNSTSVWQLVLFLRAGYYAQYYDSTDVGTYGPTLATAIEGALDTFVASPHFMDVSDANGGVTGDAIVLTDSANEQPRYLSTYKRVLNAYNSSYDAYASMDAAVNDVFTPIFRGHQNPAFITAVTADPSIIDTLDAFALNHASALSGDSYYLDSNAGTEVARFLDTAALQAKVRPLAKGLLGASAITGTSAPLWVGVAGMTFTDDLAQCSYYGTCNLATQLTAASLPTTTACGSTITLLTQALTAADLTAVCSSLQSEVPYFQNLDKVTSPIPGQYETNVRLAIFASSKDYQTYSSWIFGNSTNNGGETLSGDITDPTNQPVSVQYQWDTDNGFPARVWNLNHEFTHLMQGAYDMKGDFATQITVPDIWWIEGQAEYVSYSYRNVADTEAIADASLHTYALSTLFQSTYDNSDQTRTYPWGYLAVRYMFEKHPADIANMLTHFRTGDYAGGYAVYNSIGTGYDADFSAWLDALANAGSNGPSTPCTDPDARAMGQNCYRTNESAAAGNDEGLFVYLPAGTSTLTITTSGGTGNADLYYNPDTWASPTAFTASSTNSGNNDSITVTSTNAAPGYRYIDLHATTAFSGVTVTTRYVFGTGGGTGGGTLPACTATDTRVMDQNCSRANQAATVGNSDYYYLYLPAGTSNLTVTSSGGTGNADLYYNPNTWASPTAYTAESTNSGNNETITVTNTTAGYRYITLYAATGFSGVTVSTQY